MTDDTLLTAVGSPHGDDQVGWLIAEHLREKLDGAVAVRTMSVPLDMLDQLDGIKNLHIVDACNGDRLPGHLYRWNWRMPREHEAPVESSTVPDRFVLRGTGTHDFDVLSVLHLAERLGRLPPLITIWGIQGQRFRNTATLSPAVARRLPEITNTIAKELTDARTLFGAVAAEPD